jgi:NAD(P)-dependent dehydrogenase (short-subunit alcohol dehydrogenase family)
VIRPEDALLSDRVVVVTGAAQGIGKAAALACAAHGADLAICDRNPAVVDTASAIEALGRRALTGVFDVRDAGAVGAHLGEVGAAFGRVDVLVNNAGGGFKAPFLEVNEKGTRSLIDENYTQVLHFIRGCAPLFPEGGGSIVNVTSVEAHRAAPGYAVYASMKAAVEQLTRTLALELADRRIRVNALAVDVIRTEAFGDVDPATLRTEQIPLGHFGEPDDVAGPIVFLAGDLSRFVTGSTLHVDAGTNAAGGWRRDGSGGWEL